MRSVRDIPIIENIPVMVRAALNVPLVDGVVENDFRLRRALPTLQFLLEHNARVVIIGHIGEAGTETLRPVYEAMKKYIPSLLFCGVTTGEEARRAIREVRGGSAIMLENLRRDKGEVGNDKEFAKKLAALADVFVQDSFDVCHREHASVVSLPTLLPSYAGLLVEEEVEKLNAALHPKRPSLAIVGGAKFSTKEPVIKTLLATYDHVFVGGALANDFLKEKGVNVAVSSVSNPNSAVIKKLLENPKLLLPIDAVSAPLDSKREAGHVGWPKENEAILDAGPETLAMLAPYIEKARTILWNGPLGNYENGFSEGTEEVAGMITSYPRVKNWLGFQVKKETIIGGGDTVAAVEKLGTAEKFSFISTGGGAMLDFIAKGTLPGLRALAK